jgi:hypothetical protein
MSTFSSFRSPTLALAKLYLALPKAHLFLRQISARPAYLRGLLINGASANRSVQQTFDSDYTNPVSCKLSTRSRLRAVSS